MHLLSLNARAFKRFTDLRVEGLAPQARLIVLAGPNGTGKSSFFDALKVWHWIQGGPGGSYDLTYHDKVGDETRDSWTSRISASVDAEIGTLSPEQKKKLVYVRSAHRNEADFSLSGLSQLPPALDATRVQRTIDNDSSVSANYQRLVMDTFTAVFDTTADDQTTRAELRDAFVGQIRASLQVVFPDLTLKGLSHDPLSSGTFSFSKGKAQEFAYKNLSAGEKAVFDLILDVVVSGRHYDDTIWCIDEPETHLNVRVQAALLDQLLALLPGNCQLILASHSLGFMRRAWELAQAVPTSVQFIDFQNRDFDAIVQMAPTAADRSFWNRTLDVAMGDLAALVAPEQLVLCEGRPATSSGKSTKSEFDASCYRRIFAPELPNTDFVSIGNNDDVKNDKLGLGKSIAAITTGTKVIRVIDRDLLSQQEVDEQTAAGVRVLGRRNIEAYLLDDEVITAFAAARGTGDAAADAVAASELITERDSLLAASVGRGNDADDLKSVAGEWYNDARKRFALTGAGSNWSAFAVEYMAPLLSPGMNTYAELKASIFG